MSDKTTLLISIRDLRAMTAVVNTVRPTIDDETPVAIGCRVHAGGYELDVTVAAKVAGVAGKFTVTILGDEADTL